MRGRLPGDAMIPCIKPLAHALEIQDAHGSSILRFHSSFSNRRTDEYGGSLENRMRFCREIEQGVREATGPDYPLFSC